MAMTPPSPSLPARIMSTAYLAATMRTNAHSMRETAPITASDLSSPPAAAALAASLRA